MFYKFLREFTSEVKSNFTLTNLNSPFRSTPIDEKILIKPMY